MKKKYRCLPSGISKLLQGGLLASLAVVFLALPVASNAQETTAAIRGKIYDPAGDTVGGAAVVVEDLRNGVTRSYTANDTGVFLATQLLPGGPYRVTVNGVKSVEVPSISVGDTYNLTVNLQTEAAIEEIVAIGQAANFVEVASGPAATFTIDDLENSVSFSRDIADVYGIDPRLMIDNDEDGFGVNCAGKHPRFNNVTLDGVSQTDRFGLNENGYSTAVGMPFPYDGIEQIAVELAPFDVTYGGFSACNINSVTKSGTNEWEGKVFYEYSSDSFRGDRVADDPNKYTTPSYDKTYMGFNVGGPIIKDKLFIFAAYEESDEPRFLAKGYAGSGNGEERDWLSQSDYERIASIASSRYGYTPGGQPTDGSQEAEKYLVRLDWNINDNHNAALIYNYFDGFQDRDSDGDDDEFEFANHYYVKGAESETITVKLWSQWNDAFSTELFYSDAEMNDSQVTVGDKDFGEMQVSIGGRDGIVYLGADDSRQANSLYTRSDYLKLAANYLVGDHIITAGYEREDLEIFNIFVQHSRGGEYRFFDDSGDNPAFCADLDAQGRFEDPECDLSGMDRFELGRPSRIYYGSGGGTNVANDAAANFTNSLNSLYLQDEIFFDNLDLTLVAGLRYEWFDSNDSPVFNQAFTDALGVRNDSNIDGLDIIMPRIGFTWGVNDALTLRGGMGLYSGGNPNVWISNAWSNDGVTNVQTGSWDDDEFCGDYGECDPDEGTFTIFALDPNGDPNPDAIELSGDERPGYSVPQSMIQFVADTTADDANTRSIVLLDPDYEQPSEWKLALGGTWETPWEGWTLDFDYLYSRANNPAYYVDLSQSIVGETILGTPIYDFTNGQDNMMLTNSSENPTGSVFSLVMQKSFDFGLDVLLGYAYSDAEDVSPMTSAVAVSNYENLATLDINYPKAATSNWVVPHRFTLRLDYERAFFGDNLTRFTLFGYINEGQAQSYAMNGGDLEGDGFYGRHLLYVPTGPEDGNVIFDEDFDQTGFFDWVRREGLKGGTFVSRNSINAGWSNRFDLRISQELSLGNNLQGRLYFKVYNFGNMLNDDWGKIVDAQFFTPEVVDAGVDEDTGQFIYYEFSDRSVERTYINRSLWEARLGIDIKFGGF